jgi:uncharacterized protein YfcZ (UPF0381/DUF406 family)
MNDTGQTTDRPETSVSGLSECERILEKLTDIERAIQCQPIEIKVNLKALGEIKRTDIAKLAESMAEKLQLNNHRLYR